MLTVMERPQSESAWQPVQSDRSSLPEIQGFLAAPLPLSTVVWIMVDYNNYNINIIITDIIAVSLLDQVNLVLPVLSGRKSDELTN